MKNPFNGCEKMFVLRQIAMDAVRKWPIEKKFTSMDVFKSIPKEKFLAEESLFLKEIVKSVIGDYLFANLIEIVGKELYVKKFIF